MNGRLSLQLVTSDNRIDQIIVTGPSEVRARLAEQTRLALEAILALNPTYNQPHYTQPLASSALLLAGLMDGAEGITAWAVAAQETLRKVQKLMMVDLYGEGMAGRRQVDKVHEHLAPGYAYFEFPWNAVLGRPPAE